MKQSQDNATIRPRGSVDFDYQVSIDLMQIALASLNAVHKYNTSSEDGSSDINLNLSKEKFNKCHSDYRWISYTAPPVPVIKLADDDCVVDEIGKHYSVLSFSERRHITRMVLNEIKRFNGLRL